MLNDYWSKNGSADLLILSTKEDDMKTVAIISEYLVVPMKISTHGSITGFKALEESVILGYADVNQLNHLYNLGSYNKMEIGEASINTTLAKKLKLELNSEITLDESNYLITNISDRINLVGTDMNMMLINTPDDIKDYDYTAYLVNCMHEEKSIQSVISLLNQNNINYINLYDNIGTIMNEFQRLLSSVIMLILVVIIICSVLIYSIYSINLKRCLSQWGTLRTLGLKNSTMVRVMVIETLLFSVVGIIAGTILGISLGYLICLLSGTEVLYIIPDRLLLLTATAIGIVIPITSVLFSIKPAYRKQPIEIIFVRKKQMPTGNDKITNVVHLGIGLIIIVCSILPVSTSLDKGKMVVIYGVQFIFSFIGVILILMPIIKYATKLLESSKSQSIKLACQNIRIHIANIKGIVISISLTVIIFCTMVGFSANYKEWAGAMAHEQLGFDILLSSKNNDLYQGYMDSYIMNEDIVVIGDNYLDTVNIRGIDNYICAISSEDFNRIYKSKIDLDNLKGNRVVIPSKLMVDLNVNEGDELLLHYKGQEKNVIVAEMTEVMDYSSHVIYISKELFDIKSFAKYTVYANVNDNTTLDELEEKSIEKNLSFLSVADIKEDWKENIVSGVKEIEYMIVVILAILIFMLKNTLESNIEERKHDFMILRSIGLKRKKINTILSMEFLVTQVITIIISVCIGSITSMKFFYMNCVTSGYTIDYDVTWRAFILIGIIFLIVSYMFVLRVFRNTSNKDIINEIRLY
jgi:ABC-type antimicrobial peptide transport system permease subunit